MGWKCRNPEHRNKLLNNAISYQKQLAPTDIVMCDGNAWFRRHLTGTVPIKVGVNRILKQFLGTKPKKIAIFWDNDNVPEARKAVWNMRQLANKETHITDEQMTLLTTTKTIPQGVTWQQLFAFSDTKRIALNLIVEEIQWSVVKIKGDNAKWIISMPYSTRVWTYPFGDTQCEIESSLRLYKYGEAEAQLVMGLRHAVCSCYNLERVTPSVTVFTIDTDIALQLCAAWATKTTIVWAKVWTNGESIFRTLKKAGPNAIAQWEVINGRRAYGGVPRQKLAWNLFCMLCAGGVDYCSGIGSFGWGTSVIIDKWINRSSCQHIITIDSCNNTYTINMKELFRLFRLTRKTKSRDTPGKNGGADAFVSTLNEILFCFQYYIWHNAAPDEGVSGPRMMAHVESPEARAVSTYITTHIENVILVDDGQCSIDLTGAGNRSDTGYYMPLNI